MPAAIAFSTSAPNAPFEKVTIERRPVGPHDVLIDIAYAGICHSDIHTARGEWGKKHYPLVPGHEIAGVVTEVGTQVTKFAVGDRAGVGCFVDSCRECEDCLEGEEQYCRKGMVGTYDGIGADGRPTDGGYSSSIVVDENYVMHIPDSLALDVAAPLLCAGVTLYSPLKRWSAGPGTKVAIVGLGGLGHMGVKIAHALGAEVTVLSQTMRKHDDAMSLGADHFFATQDDATFETLHRSFDLIINTVSVVLPMDKYLSLLKRDGTLVSVGVPELPMTVNAGVLVGLRRRWAGSEIGGIRETQEMLEFCAEHGLGAEIEIISGDQIDEAWERVIASDVRYRFVIDTATF